jgi:hypothetical protein
MAGLNEQETGSTEEWNCNFVPRNDFPTEEGGNPCGQCGHDPCICFCRIW